MHGRPHLPPTEGNEREEGEFQIINGRAGADALILICVRRCTGGGACAGAGGGVVGTGDSDSDSGFQRRVGKVQQFQVWSQQA
jgi:hypothetical protein